VDSLKLGFEDAANILREMTPGFESGEFPPPAVETFPLARAPEIYRDMNEGRLRGKIVLNP
jgi:NADPH:quinone reductase-like Zn-dependent oxidoreductase